MCRFSCFWRRHPNGPYVGAHADARERKQRRYRTGRNRHLGIKATTETVELFHKIADTRSLSLGELLRLALDALEQDALLQENSVRS